MTPCLINRVWNVYHFAEFKRIVLASFSLQFCLNLKTACRLWRWHSSRVRPGIYVLTSFNSAGRGHSFRWNQRSQNQFNEVNFSKTLPLMPYRDVVYCQYWNKKNPSLFTVGDCQNFQYFCMLLCFLIHFFEPTTEKKYYFKAECARYVICVHIFKDRTFMSIAYLPTRTKMQWEKNQC